MRARFIWIVVVVAIVAAAAAPGAASGLRRGHPSAASKHRLPAPPDVECPAVRTRPGKWREVSPPPFEPNPLAIEPYIWGPGILAFASDPVDAGRLFASDGTDVFRTTDGGCSWKKVYSVPRGAREIYSIDIAPAPENKTIYLQAFNGLPEVVATAGSTSTVIVVSKDGGDSWAELPVDPSPGGVALQAGDGELVISDTDPKVLYAARQNVESANLLTSRDGGESWEVRTLPESAYILRTLALNPADPDDLWAAATGRGTENLPKVLWQRLFRSRDGGKSWDHIDNVPLAQEHILGISVSAESPTGPTYVGIAAGGLLIVSDDGGENWTDAGVSLKGTRQRLIGVVQGKKPTDLFVIDQQQGVHRIDFRREIAVTLKDARWGEGAEGTYQGDAFFSPAGGLFVLEGCPPASGCSLLINYRGRGAL